MEEQILEKALDDVQLIKSVISRATDSIYSLGKVFMWWGGAFLFISIISLLSYFNWPNLANILREYNLLAMIPKILVGITTLVIYFVSAKKTRPSGLNRQFLIIWLTIICYVTLWTVLNRLIFYKATTIIMDDKFTILGMFTGYPIFPFAIGMLSIQVLTHLKFPGWLTVVYLIFYLIENIISILTKYTYNFKLFLSIINCISIPLIFTLLGVYLEYKRAKSNCT